MRRIFIGVVVAMLTACGGNPLSSSSIPPRIAGTVFDTAGHALVQARVEMVEGPHAGAVAMTNANGYFSFDNVSDSAFTVRASKEGYLDQSFTVSKAGGVAFLLDGVSGPFHVYGNYEVTFEADSDCTDLPPAVRSRTYRAVFAGSLTASGSPLSGATFVQESPLVSFNGLGIVVVNGATQLLFDDPGIWELMTPDTSLEIWGDGGGTVGADTSQWSWSGSVVYCPSAVAGPTGASCRAPEVTCQSAKHQVTLRRR